MALKTITISRKKWLRGKRLNEEAIKQINHLWDSKEQAGCCLGHVIHQTTRCAWSALDGLCEPRQFFNGKSILTNAALGDPWAPYRDNNVFADDAMTINDNDSLSEAEREQALIDLFKKNKLKLVFKD